MSRTKKCNACFRTLDVSLLDDSSICSEPRCQQILREGIAWAKSACDRIFSHYTPDEMTAMRAANARGGR